MAGSDRNEHLGELQGMCEEIRKIESEIAESLKTIRERLSSDHLKQKALHEIIRGIVLMQERSSYFLRRHPITALLGGFLLGWLALRSWQHGSLSGRPFHKENT